MYKKTKLKEMYDKKNRLISKQKESYIQVTYTSRKDGIKHIKFEIPDRYIYLSE